VTASLARSLLEVPCVQMGVAGVLASLLAEAAAEEGAAGEARAAALLAQFRWLDYVVDPGGLVTVLLLVAESARKRVQPAPAADAPQAAFRRWPRRSTPSCPSWPRSASTRPLWRP